MNPNDYQPPNQNPQDDLFPSPPPDPNPPQHEDPNQAAELVRQQVQHAYDQQAQAQTPGATYHPFQPDPPEPQPAAEPRPEPVEQQDYGTFNIPGQNPVPIQQTPPSQPNPLPPQPYPEPPKPIQPIGEQAAENFAQQTQPTGPVAGSGDVTIADLKKQILNKVEESNKVEKESRWKPFFVAIAITVLFLGVSYNEVAIAQIRQYISPGSSVSTPVILDPSQNIEVGQEPRIIIPKINVDVPVVYDITSYDEDEIQAGLERGVVHYGRTALPGEKGNNVIVGHSSNNFFNSGKYKFAFVLLDRLEIGDTFILHYEGTRYIYRVNKKEVIEPTDFSLVQPTNTPTTTLITCTPPGTSWRRLVIQGEQISPSPNQAVQSTAEVPEVIDTPVPGNAPSFWSQVRDAIF